MKGWRILAFLVLFLSLAGSLSCNPLGKSADGASQQLAEVKRGDLTVAVSGSGKIAVTNEIKLAFGVGGRVEKIYVEEGDNVSRGTVLAKLETSLLELSLVQAQIAHTKAQVAVTEAELGRKTAEYNLRQAQDLYTRAEVHQARAAVKEGRTYLDYAELQLAQASTPGDIRAWTREVADAREKLRAAEVALNEMLSAPDTEEVAIRKLQVELSEKSLELAGQAVEVAKRSVEQAQKQLQEATIIAPFDGVVAEVYVEEGDVIPPPTLAPKPILHLIDPGSMKLEVQVDEMDVAGVKLGQRAVIEVDALPALPLAGEVSSISLLPREQASLIVYDVRIKFPVPHGSGLRVGMSATAEITVHERRNVLIVPERAIRQDKGGKLVVEVMVKGQIEERAVVTGVSDGLRTEILAGLREGEVVVEKRGQPRSSGFGLLGQ